MRGVRALTACAALVLSATTAAAHAELTQANPPVGGTVKSAPAELTLRFSQSLEPKFSGAQVTGPAGRVDHGVSVSGSTIRISVGRLSPGTYHVSWHALSIDTHKTQGSYSFTIAP